MKSIEELNKSRLPIVKINKKLNIYDDIPLFQDKVDEANKTLKRVGLPVIPLNNQGLVASENQDSFLERVNHTITLIQQLNVSIKQALLNDAPPSLIASKQKTKMHLVNELMTLMSEIDVRLGRAIASDEIRDKMDVEDEIDRIFEREIRKIASEKDKIIADLLQQIEELQKRIEK